MIEPNGGRGADSPVEDGSDESLDEFHRSNRDRRLLERRIWRRSFAAAVILHLLLFLLWTSSSLPRSPFAAEGTRSQDPNPAEGAMQAMSMRPVVPEPIVPPVVPVPEIEAVDPPEIDEEPEIDVGSLEDLRPGEDETEGDRTGDAVAGLADATGRGDAGSGGEGLRRVIPPSPRGMIIPPSNENLRGTSVEVWVFVDARGQVVPDSTRLNPPTRDRRFNERIEREAAEWIFEPARRDGEPVAAWFPYTITM